MNSTVPVRQHGLVACGIAILVSILLAMLCMDVVREFFPYAEEWKIMRPSLPGLANPAEWFMGFAQVGVDPYPAWSVEAINFWRPVMHVVYWLRGVLFGDAWGVYLYVNFAAIGIAAGALYLCLRSLKPDPSADPRAPLPGIWLALLLVGVFLLMPPMISATSRFLPVLVPQFPFGRLLAALCLLAALSYVYRRYLLATLLVTAALLTKEQAIPMAIALPLTHAWVSRRDLRGALPALLLLATPLAAWIFLRLFLFGSIAQGVYVLADGSGSQLRSLIGNLLKLPLYAPSVSGALLNPISIPGLLLACNAIVLGYLGIDGLKRLWDRGLDVISVAFVGYWGFLAIVGLNPRYGTLIIALAILMLARRPAAGIPRVARGVALGALVVTGLVHGTYSLRSFDTHVTFSQTIYEVGRDYATALSEVPPDTETVVVLNDPNTVYTAPSDMAKVLGLPVTSIHKASDYPWQWPSPYATAIPEQPCSASASATGGGTVELKQSCGLRISGALVPHEKPPVLPLGDGIEAVFPQATFNEAGRVAELGERLVLHVRRPGVSVLYFDPENRTFRWLKGPADATPSSDK